MKKRLKKWLLPLFTLLLVAVGAAMPFIASYMQDAQQAEADIRPFDSFSLTLQQQGTDLARLLKAVGSGAYYIHEASKAEEVTLSERLALAAAEDLLEELVEYGLLNKETLERFSGPKVQAQQVIPVVYTNAETDQPAATLPGPDYDAFPGEYTEEAAIPTWTITWNQPDNCWIWLDDASGKAIMIEVPVLTGLGVFDETAKFRERVYAQADKWRIFLSDYYGTAVQVADEEWYNSTVKFVLAFPLGVGEDQEVFHLDLYFYSTTYSTVLSPYVS